MDYLAQYLLYGRSRSKFPKQPKSKAAFKFHPPPWASPPSACPIPPSLPPLWDMYNRARSAQEVCTGRGGGIGFALSES